MTYRLNFKGEVSKSFYQTPPVFYIFYILGLSR